ncbi:MAG: carbohydrate binding domain-containing protein [Candidatus Sulfotelmatobacter sp.]
MRIELRSTLRKFCFAGACFIVAGLYLLFTGRAYSAAHAAANPTLLNIQRAIQLEPSNAEYRELLGRNLALSGASLDEAISDYRTAVRLNPYESRYWLDLASAYQVAGRIDEEEQAVEHAVDADPTTPHVAAEAANFFLLQGNLEGALRHFRTVLANDPELVNPTLQLCWRVTGDANQIFDRALPRRLDLYSSFLQLLVSKQEVAAAENAWERLIGLQQIFPTKLAVSYFRLLLAKQEVAAAQTAWQQLAYVDEAIRPYLPSRENLIVNGGFEENLLNGGFDWWYESTPHAALAIDTDQFYQGTRSLSVTFDGRSVSEARISQFIPVKPDTDYEFNAESKTQDIDSASGPRFAIVDAYTNVSYVLTDDLLGTNPWHLQQARFHTGPKTNLLFLRIVRQPAAPLIRGKLWIDDVRLVEKQN